MKSACKVSIDFAGELYLYILRIFTLLFCLQKINMPIKSMLTGQWMEKGDELRDWQEFIFMRQEKAEGKLQFGALSSEYTTIMEQVDKLLEGQPGKVSEAVTQLVVTATYMHYNKAFLMA
jgi:hypothetical protein